MSSSDKEIMFFNFAIPWNSSWAKSQNNVIRKASFLAKWYQINIGTMCVFHQSGWLGRRGEADCIIYKHSSNGWTADGFCRVKRKRGCISLLRSVLSRGTVHHSMFLFFISLFLSFALHFRPLSVQIFFYQTDIILCNFMRHFSSAFFDFRLFIILLLLPGGRCMRKSWQTLRGINSV